MCGTSKQGLVAESILPTLELDVSGSSVSRVADRSPTPMQSFQSVPRAKTSRALLNEFG